MTAIAHDPSTHGPGRRAAAARCPAEISASAHRCRPASSQERARLAARNLPQPPTDHRDARRSASAESANHPRLDGSGMVRSHVEGAVVGVGVQIEAMATAKSTVFFTHSFSADLPDR